MPKILAVIDPEHTEHLALTRIKELPTEHKIIFDQEIYNEEGKLLTIGKVKLYFMDSKLGKRASMPASMLEKLSTYFR